MFTILTIYATVL